MDNIKNKDININSVEIKNGKYKIGDQDKLNYTFWKTKKDGDKGAVYQQWEAMGLDQNSIVSIGYVEEPASFMGKDGKEVNYTDRRIISFRETSATPVTTSAQTPHHEPPVASQSTSSKQDETFWDKKAYKQCLWNYWLQTPIKERPDDWKDLVWDIFNFIETDADERFSPAPTPYKFKREESAPKEEVADDIRDMAAEMASDNNIDTEDIPF